VNTEPLDLKAMVKQRWNEAAEGFDNSPGHGIHSAQEKQIWQTLLAKLLGEKPLEVLDVGTGTGVIALMLAEMGHKVTGIDLAEEMLVRARKKAEQMGIPVNFLLGDAENIPFNDGAFDIVINRHVFWTMPDPERAAAEWVRVLKPGGKLVIIDGDWDNCRYYKKIWRELAKFLILVTEMRNPWSKNNKFCQFEKHLPLRHKKRPEADLEILNGLGLQAKAFGFKDPHTHNFLNYLKYGHYERFVVIGVKPNGRVQDV